MIDLQAGDPAAAERARQWELERSRSAVPLPAYVEWLQEAHLKGGKTLANSLHLAENLEVLPADTSVAEDAARFGAESIRRGRTLSASDLLIAAITRRHRAILVTRDKDLMGLPGLAAESY